jgi:hypothetical protein
MKFLRLPLCLLSGFFLAATAQSQTSPPAPPAAQIYTETTVDKAPTPKRRIRPDFPSSLKKRDTPGEITLRYVVTPEGKVTEITVVKFNDADMVEPCYIAFEEALFTPGEKAGKPVSVRMETTILFPEPKAPKKKKE